MDSRLQHLLHTFQHAPPEPSPVSSETHEAYGGKGHAEEEPSMPGGEVIVVNDLVSRAASVYEILRNTIEYSEAHLLRRNAIRRILRRRLSNDDDVALVARELLHELIWARYLPNKAVPLVRESEVTAILEKYQSLFSAAEKERESGRLTSWIFDLVSTEIEYLLTPPDREEAMVTYAYGTLRTHAVWAKKLAVSEEEKDVQLYVGVHRTLLKSNEATLRYRVFALFYPAWPQASSELVAEVAEHLPKVVAAVEKHLFHPVGETVSRALRPRMVLFKILQDMLLNAGAHSAEIVSDVYVLKEAAEKAAKRRYSVFHARLWRIVLRAVLFLFCTKLILAFIIELPYEALVLRETNYGPLLINILFHPALLALLGLTGTIPEKKNTKMLVDGVQALVAGGADVSVTITAKKPWARGTAGAMFSMLYALMYVVSYGALVLLLLALEFNVVSIALFLLFLSLVTFFGISIRASRRELVIVPGKSGFISAIGDMFTLPILRAGRWISMHAPRVNVFLFFLDFIIEAPFKMVIQLIEGWLAFLKEKKEELGA